MPSESLKHGPPSIWAKSVKLDLNSDAQICKMGWEQSDATCCLLVVGQGHYCQVGEGSTDRQDYQTKVRQAPACGWRCVQWGWGRKPYRTQLLIPKDFSRTGGVKMFPRKSGQASYQERVWKVTPGKALQWESRERAPRWGSGGGGVSQSSGGCATSKQVGKAGSCTLLPAALQELLWPPRQVNANPCLAHSLSHLVPTLPGLSRFCTFPGVLVVSHTPGLLILPAPLVYWTSSHSASRTPLKHYLFQGTFPKQLVPPSSVSPQPLLCMS